MGSSPSLAQAQCPVEPVKQAQIPINCKCGNSKVKWRCENCVSMLCDMCKDKDHAAKGHHIIDITTIQVKISKVKEYKPNDMFIIQFLAVAHDNSIWFGDGNFKEVHSLQNVKLVGDKMKVISSFNMDVKHIAVSPNNDLLLITPGEPRLKLIKAGSNKVTDSVYYAELPFANRVHVTKDGRVMISESKHGKVVVMDTDGKHLTSHRCDANLIRFGTIASITSTSNGNIFLADNFGIKVVVFKKTEIINIYRGHPTVNNEVTEFYPSSVVTTPIDNVIVADTYSHTLHILNNRGHLLTTYNTKDIGIPSPYQLAITTEGSLNVLYMTRRSFGIYSVFKMVITGC